jgi:putrescine aminotransferase
MDSDRLYDEVVSKTAQYVNPGLARLLSFAGFGVEMSASGCEITDHEGKTYLDCLGGYGTFALGHRHPRVVAAVKDQLDKMALGSKTFFSKPQADLAEKLAKIAPEGLQYTFFCNSGAEAVEAALKLAKGATRRPKFVSTTGAYHGKTLGSLSVTGREKYQTPFLPLMERVEFVEFGDSAAAEAAIDSDTAAMIVETIQGEGGIIIPPQGYLSDLRAACDKAGALLIVDEVQTGIGRTGTWFGSDHEPVKPDLMPLAKALGGGVMPIGACMGTAAVWDAVFGENPLLHTSTFGGNPLACSAGIAALETIEVEGLLAQCVVRGAELKSSLEYVRVKHSDLIVDVRGVGLMIGVELAMDEVGELIVAQLLQRGIVVAYTLNNPRVLRFEPPLILSSAQAKFAASKFEEAVAEVKNLMAAFA